MEERKLKDVMGKVHIKSKMEEEILKNVMNAEKEQGQMRSTGIKKNVWQKRAVAAAIALAVVGAGGITVHAVVDNLVKQRMESMPKEEKADLVDEVDMAGVETTYSREFTQEEEARTKELIIEYQKDGRFPEGELKRVEDESKVDKDTLCFVPKAAYFYLPDRNLTDEELLQIIDYSKKVDYALQERYKEKYPEEAAAREEKEKEARQKLEAEGAISEDEAVAKAQEWLEKLCGTTGEGMELKHYIDTVIFGTEESPVYFVGWFGGGCCYFYIDIDGTLLGFVHGDNTSSTSVDAEEMFISEAEKKVDSLRQAAEKYLKDSFGISEDYKKVYCEYQETVDGNKVTGNDMIFSFVQEDGKAYAVTLSCVDEYLHYYDVIDNYNEKLKEEEAMKEQMIKDGEIGEKVRIELE